MLGLQAQYKLKCMEILCVDIFPLNHALTTLSIYSKCSLYIYFVYFFRREYKLKCMEILCVDIDSAHNCHLDQSLWKTAYYQPIELIRRMIQNHDDQWEPGILEQNLSAIIEDVSDMI